MIGDYEIETSTSLKDLVAYEITKFKDKLEDISETASKEYSNERTYEKMLADWMPMDFTCKEWKGSFILEGEAIEML